MYCLEGLQHNLCIVLKVSNTVLTLSSGPLTRFVLCQESITQNCLQIVHRISNTGFTLSRRFSWQFVHCPEGNFNTICRFPSGSRTQFVHCLEVLQHRLHIIIKVSKERLDIVERFHFHNVSSTVCPVSRVSPA